MENSALFTDLFYARSLMALSLGFHIIFASIGIGMPFLMALAQLLWFKDRQAVYLELSEKWSKGTALLFVIGAISGTVLSFELGLLWPKFMEAAGATIGVAFSLEGFAFFMEAIFLGVFLYGRDKLPPLIHSISAIIVAISGLLSAVFVVATNAWMNHPYNISDNPLINVFTNPMFPQMAIHLVLASYISCFLLVAGVHAYYLLKDKGNVFHREAFKLSVIAFAVIAPFMLISGDHSAKVVYKLQPIKFAALEAHYHTEQPASFVVGGIANNESMTVDYAVKIPRLLSFLTNNNFDAEVQGLEEFPKEDWPNTNIVHIAFTVMIACGSILVLLSLWILYAFFIKKNLFESNNLIKALILASPLGFIAMEAGWIVTEVGRQPWIIYGIMRTKEAVTTVSNIGIYFYIFAALYLTLAITLTIIMRRIFRKAA